MFVYCETILVFGWDDINGSSKDRDNDHIVFEFYAFN